MSDAPAPTATEKNDTIPEPLLRDDPVDEVDNVSAELDGNDGEEIVNETPESAEAQDEKTEEAVEPPEELTQIPATKSKSQNASPSALSPDVAPGVNDGVASVAGSSVGEQELQDEKKNEEFTAATTDDSPKPSRMKTPVAPVHTPKKPKRTTSKTRKTPPTLKSGNYQPVKARRSSRIKHESPKSVKPLADGTALSHFIRLPPSISCNYCGKETEDLPGNAAGHLKSCPVKRTQQLTATQKEEVVPGAVELPLPAPPRVSTNPGMTLVQLMGTKALAAKVQGAFASDPFAGDVPIGHFDSIVNNDATGLRHLAVVSLLDAVDPLDGPILQLQTTVPGKECRTGHDQLEPLSKAKDWALDGNSLRFPAPRTVAEQFIAPLAKELGLEYAMHQHTAKVVSCPRDGIGLDWRFRQTETVVFQLRGKATWKLKKGEVELPLERRTGTEGFLLPPREDLHVFDEEGSEKNELLKHLLKPGSVAYVPAGVWFQMTTKGESALWIEVELSSMSYATLVLLAMKQLTHGYKQARKRLQIHQGDRNQAKSVRRHLEACIQALRNEMTELKGTDLVPEYRCTDDLPDLISRGLIRDVSTSPDCLSIEVDLTNPNLKLKHEKVFKDAVYRVNPVALLLREDFIPHRTVEEKRDPVCDRSSPSQKTHRALKKTPKLPPKRTQALATTNASVQN
ncbi:hypothetical protein V7S43_008505 [Phytophthora oleae]|uniref:JmjC domain-containing protein n=1 Tax=Phytophthora oleae TaxID=2107226 RepID=A0ABD3FIV6_9STRA